MRKFIWNRFPTNFLPSFSYGGAQGLKTYAFDKAIESNIAMMERRGVTLIETDREILQHIFDQTAKWRKVRRSLINRFKIEQIEWVHFKSFNIFLYKSYRLVIVQELRECNP